MLSKTYHGMLSFDNFEDRFEYLKLSGRVGSDTFGSHRYLNQRFYRSREWKSARSKTIIRDNGCNLGIADRPIGGIIFVHHINPITVEMIENFDPELFDLNNLVCVDDLTHTAIHYGNSNSIERDYTPRKPGDTKLW